MQDREIDPVGPVDQGLDGDGVNVWASDRKWESTVALTANGTYAVRSIDGLMDVARLASEAVLTDLPEPFGVKLTAETSEIDAFGHVNNTAYQRWMEACAWAHSSAVDLNPQQCRDLGRGMALSAVEVEYLKPSFLGQEIWVLNWIVRVDRLRAERRFQVICGQTGVTLARCRGAYVCIDLRTGAPTRMPAAFLKSYVVRPAVEEALRA